MYNKPDIKEILNKIEKLPNVNQVALRLIKMLDNEKVTIKELSEVISTDPALTSQLLKLSNSAYFGFSREISTVSDAIARLGFKTIKSITFMSVSHNAINRELKGYDLCQGELWNNSITCAAYAKFLAQKFDYPDVETAFVAGLLRDIGKLIIDEYIGISYGDIVAKVNSEQISFSRAEESLFGFDHGYIGAKLAEKWNFPAVLVETIQYHHNFKQAMEFGCEHLKLISIIHIADALTMMTGSGLGNDGLMYCFDTETFKQFGIPDTPASIEILVADIVELKSEVDKLKGLIND